MSSKKRRKFGQRIDFKSLTRAPVSELGVVYLFGVLHKTFDFKIQSIQPGFPDCIAWLKDDEKGIDEEWKIEFEYESKSFLRHKHDPSEVNMIVCWVDNWPDRPEEIEVLELSETLKEIADIDIEIQDPKKLSAWNRFCSEKRVEGFSFAQIAELWQEQKGKHKKKDKGKKPASKWQKFCAEMRLKGKSFSEIGELWRKRKSKIKS